MKISRETVNRWLVPGCVAVVLLVVAGAAAWEWRASSRSLAAGLASFQAGDNLRAIRHLTRATQACETDIMARYHLGAAFQNYGWDSEAEQQYLVACELSRDFGARAWHSLGRIRFHRGDEAGAVEAFEQALKLDAKGAVIWFELGQAYLVLDNQAEAEHCFVEAAKLDPENPACQEALLKAVLLRRQVEAGKGEPAKSAPPTDNKESK
jgi:Flp pilus assembly protein TadD